MDLESLVKKAQNGDKVALEGVVVAIQDNIYYLALRMLCHPENASEATQEILILVITRLSTFQFKSKFRTWVYRVSSNYLLNKLKSQSKDPVLTFDEFKTDLESDLEEPEDLKSSPEYSLLLNEVRIMCTMAMLLCLDRKHRLTYILGDIFELDHNEASECLSLTKANYRKQLSRARSKIITFTTASCGLISPNAQCSCAKKLKGALRRKRINQSEIRIADKSDYTYSQIQQKILEMSQDLKITSLQTSIPTLKCPQNFVQLVRDLMEDT